MKRILLIALFACALALPAAASAKVVEMGTTKGALLPASNCPNEPCLAAYQVTGYQGRAGSVKDPFVVPRAGKIVAFTVKLGKLEDAQVNFFNDRFGSPPSVRLAVLRKGRTRRTRLDHRLLRQTPVFEVQDYLGSSPTFALDRPMRVARGNIVALSVPTWAPVLASGLGRTSWWRGSRPKGKCGDSRNLSPRSTQTRVGRVVKWGCTYFGVRLLYTATYVPDPRPTSGTRAGR